MSKNSAGRRRLAGTGTSAPSHQTNANGGQKNEIVGWSWDSVGAMGRGGAVFHVGTDLTKIDSCNFTLNKALSGGAVFKGMEATMFNLVNNRHWMLQGTGPPVVELGVALITGVGGRVGGWAGRNTQACTNKHTPARARTHIRTLIILYTHTRAHTKRKILQQYERNSGMPLLYMSLSYNAAGTSITITRES